MRWFFVFLLGATCGAAAMFHLSGRWYVPLHGQGTRISELHAAMVGLPASAASLRHEAPPAQAAGLPTAVKPAVAIDSMTASPLSEAVSTTSVAAPAAAAPVDLTKLAAPAVNGLLIPVVGVKAGDLVDTFTQARGAGRVHDAIDIMAARGTPVVAVNDGHVVKLFTSKPGGLTVYQFDPQDQVIYYYAHLDSYAPGLAEGQIVHRGDPIGFVGSTGNASADAPHLHFEIEILGPEKQWWHATSINPYGRFAGQP
ncbi:M23 family metallopeptidase [Rhodanobacter glycinis]|uniref:M23 family metallopeptidase n=1 Tax=Rhodanobacter glycinis TaxID=582702 RepID=UPI001128D350|nr:M23 family metallopeptidase [Rhodanobacter glycinis]TPG50082.1 M23 family metallopeptidase [Rhodanobacter glycinis]